MTDSINKAKVLVITTSYPNRISYGGIFVQTLSKKLNEYFDVEVLAPHVEGTNAVDTVEGIKIYRHRVSPWGNLGLCQGSGIFSNLKRNPFLYFIVPFLVINQIKSLIKLVKPTNVTIIHAHWLIVSGFSAVLYKLLFNKDIKIVVTIHGSDVYRFNFFPINVLKKIIINHCDGITTVSGDLERRLRKLGFKKEIQIIPMGTDTNLFKPLVVEKYDHQTRLLFVGSLIESKGVTELIEAVALLKNKNLNIKLNIVGDGNMLEKLDQQVCKNNLHSVVNIIGRLGHDELVSIYDNSDIFVLPSLSEGFPSVISEALSMGLIAITSDLPVFVELSNRGGFVVVTSKKDSKDIADKIERVINIDQKEKNEIKNAAREFAVNNLDWNVVANKYRELINECINHHK